MYVRRSAPTHFPANYRGHLLDGQNNHADNYTEDKDSQKEKKANSRSDIHKYRIRKNATNRKSDKNSNSFLENASTDDVLLLGLLIFLYVGCEHSKENLLLIGIIAYLLFGTKLNL